VPDPDISIDLLDEPVALADFETLVIRQANRVMTDWYPEARAGARVLEAIPGIKEKILRKRLAKKGFYETEVDDVRRDGERKIPVRVRFRRIELGDETVVVVHCKDDAKAREIGALLEIYTTSLEKKKAELEVLFADLTEEKRRVDELLLNILPREIADRMKRGEKMIADRFEEASVLFIDIVGFTALSQSMAPDALVMLLNEFFTILDGLIDRHKLEKIKTIGDAYMVAGGIPRDLSDHTHAVMRMAIDAMAALGDFNRVHGTRFQVRVGINTGPIIAGIIGVKKFSYDLWGDTVNIASRMESTGIVGAIQVSESAYQRLRDDFEFTRRVDVDVKGIGTMATYVHEPRMGESDDK
jgi:class 3 adenylate cyclase